LRGGEDGGATWRETVDDEDVEVGFGHDKVRVLAFLCGAAYQRRQLSHRTSRFASKTETDSEFACR
jgi:hypothetical protein